MKRVLITGKGSYIGTNVEEWLKRKGYKVDVIDMISDEWKKHDFCGYDSIYHVAGIAHSETNKVSDETKKLYYCINCDLAVETAMKARNAGVKQFIYMSSLLVYGDSGTGSYKDVRLVKNNTETKPSNFYGDSKWQAELKLRELEIASFQVAILRPPMVYGRNCKGNYNGMRQIALKTPWFPDYPNKRSVLYIENLCEFVSLLIESGKGGVYWPQNKEQVSTSDFIRTIAAVHGKKVRLRTNLNCLIPFCSCLPGKASSLVNKAFGSLVVDSAISNAFGGDYQIVSFDESIRRTELS